MTIQINLFQKQVLNILFIAIISVIDFYRDVMHFDQSNNICAFSKQKNIRGYHPDNWNRASNFTKDLIVFWYLHRAIDSFSPCALWLPLGGFMLLFTWICEDECYGNIFAFTSDDKPQCPAWLLLCRFRENVIYASAPSQAICWKIWLPPCHPR